MAENTRVVKIGHWQIGGDFPPLVQSMWKSPLSISSLDADFQRLEKLAQSGCHLLRFSIPDHAQAELAGILASKSPIPLIADIHFDYKLALLAMDKGFAKIRINPGNIGARWKVEEIIRKAADMGIAIRCGVNSGSLPVKLRKEKNVAGAMLKALEQQLEIFKQLDFQALVISLKSSDIEITRKVNQEYAEKYDYPLHLGLTEAGPLVSSLVKSSLALGPLLEQGLGDTLRISISASMEEEVEAARVLLAGCKRIQNQIDIISCPQCGRRSFTVHEFLKELRPALAQYHKNVTIAVMGCAVNGPQEARSADLGISGNGRDIIIFKSGEICEKVEPENAMERFLFHLDKL